MKPYYQDAAVTLYHGDCKEIIPLLPSVDMVLTDPPYGENTHAKALTNSGVGTESRKLVDFASITAADLSAIYTSCGLICDRWLVATMEWRHIASMDANPPDGWRFMRFGVWVKLNGMPQITGDRPAQGWEGICYLHSVNEKPHWNGGGNHGNYVFPVERGEHPTTKPLSMFVDLIERFTKAGDTVFDPFAGSGTTGRAAKDTGRKAILIEKDEKYCDLIARRMAQEVFNFA